MQASTPLQPTPQATNTPVCFTDFAKKRYTKMVEACQHRHTVWFHRCCFTFSSHAKRPELGHPKDQATPFLTLLEQENISSVEGFADLMHKMAISRGDSLPPTYNHEHQDEPSLNKRPLPVAEPEHTSEVQALREELAALKNRVDSLERHQKFLEEELKAERESALHNEQEYLSMMHTSEMMARLLVHAGIKIPLHGVQALGKRMAQQFQNAHPELLSFMNTPRPHHPLLPQQQPPVDPTYDMLQKLFSQVKKDIAEQVLRK